MSNVIDSRIVEMKFDNKQFESAVSTSMGTIAKLKESLNFDKNGSNFLQNLGNALGKVDLSPIANAAETAGEKFSAFEAVAVGALMKIGAQAVEAGEKLVKSLSIDQLTEGWSKYEQKTTAVQTIMAATADQFTDTGVQMDYVNGQLEKLNWFTDETSYNFVDMVGNIGKFTSNGIALDSAVTSMQGIANWAAISGQNAATASRAMYNLAQAIGVGSVKLIDWRSIENANMATQGFKKQVLEAAVAEGTLTKAADGTYKTIKGTAVSIQDFNSALSEGWFSKDVLTSVLDKYGAATDKVYELAQASDASATDILKLVEAQEKGTLTTEKLKAALGEDSDMTITQFKHGIEELSKSEYELGIQALRAAQEAKTFTDAIDATKDAVSTGWMKSFELMFGDYEHARVLWTDVANGLYDIFAAGSEARNELLKDWGNSNWETLEKDISKAGVSLEQFELSLRSVLHGKGVDVKQLEEEFGSLSDAIQQGAVDADKLGVAVSETIEGIIKGKGGKASLQSAEDKLKEIQEVVTKVWSGELGNGEERRKALEEMGYEYDAIQALVAKGADYQLELQDVLGMITDTELEAIGLSEEEIAQLREIQSDWERLNNLSGESGRQMLADSITNSLTAIQNGLQLVKETWSRVFGSLSSDTLKNITRQFRDFTASLRLFEDDGKTLTARGTAIESVLRKVFEAAKSVFDLFKNIGNIFRQFATAMSPAIKTATELGKSLLDLFNVSMGKLNKFLGNLNFSTEFQSFGETVASIIEWVAIKIDSLAVKIENSKFGEKFTELGNKASESKKKIKSFFDNMKNGVSDGSVFQNILSSIASALQKLKEFFQPVIDKLKEFWQALKGKFDFSNITSVGDAIHRIFSGIGDIAGGAFHGLLDAIDRLDISFGDLLKTFIGSKIAGKVLTNVLGGNGGGLKKNITDLIKSVREVVDNFGEKGIVGALLGDVSFGSGKSGFDKFAENIKKIGTAMLLAAGGVLALGLALLVFNTAVQMDPNGRGMMAMAVSMGMLVGVLAILSKMGGKIIFAGAAMLAASVGLAALAGALALFTLVGRMEGTTTALLSMFTTLTMVVGALMVLAQAGPKVLAAAAAMMVASVALIALAGALALFTVIGRMEGTTTALLAMFVVMTLVAGALMALSSVALQAMGAATAILLVSVALIALAGALALFTAVVNMDGTTKGLIAMAVALGIVVGALMILSGVAPMVLVAAAALALAGVAMVAIAAGLAAAGVAIGVIGAGLTVLIAGVGTAVGTAISAIGTGIGTALSAIGDGIGGIFSGIGEGIGLGIEAIGAGIATANGLIGVSVESLGTSIGLGFENVAAGIDGAALIIQAAFDRLGEGVGTTIESFGSKVGSAIEGVGESIAKAGESIRGVGDSIASVGSGISSFGESIKILGLIDLIGIGAGLIEFAKGVKKVNATPIKVDASGLVDYTVAVSNFTTLASTVNTIALQIEARMLQLGANMGNNVGSGLASTVYIAESSANTLGASAMNAVNAYTDSFFIIGANMAIGLANGIVSESETVNRAASAVASNAAQSARNAAQERSPSRVFAQIGEYMSLGLAEGIGDEEKTVTDSAQAIAQAAIDSVGSILNNEVGENTFTITPVVDLTNVREGASQLDSLFYNSNATIGFGAANIGKMVNSEEIDRTASNKSLSRDLDSIFQKIGTLADHIDNLQVVLDTGTLVGATSAKMDSQFGIMSMRRGRGN